MSLAHSPSIITSNLVLCLDAANSKSYPGSGTTWTDLSGNGNNGTLVNGVGYSGDNLGSLVFDGVDDYVSTNFFPSDTILGQNFSWFFWAKYTRFAFNIGSHGNATGGSSRFYTQIMNTNGDLRTAIGDSFYTSTTLGTENLNKWIMIGFVYDSGTVETYVNSVLVDERDGVNFSGTSSSSWSVGRGFDESRFFEGESSNHTIYKKSLTSQEIQQNFNALRSRFQ
jgi:hypothetical protein